MVMGCMAESIASDRAVHPLCYISSNVQARRKRRMSVIKQSSYITVPFAKLIKLKKCNLNIVTFHLLGRRANWLQTVLVLH